VALAGPPILGLSFLATNRAVWSQKFKKEFGPLPNEFFVPSEVRCGIEPLGRWGIILIGVGIALAILGAVTGVDGLVETAWFICMPPLAVILGLVMASIGSLSGQIQLANVIGIDRSLRREYVESLSGLITDYRNDEVKRLYCTAWRAFHKGELATEKIGQKGQRYNETVLQQIRSQYDEIIADAACTDILATEVKRKAALLEAFEKRVIECRTGLRTRI
jgi:hypothetical protein